MAELTHGQREILSYLARQRDPEDYQTAVWIAEGCGHFYETAWASSKLPALLRRGLIQRGGKGYYAITPAGRAALNGDKS
jgi:DNA-binding PadR family transcriptional regulator